MVNLNSFQFNTMYLDTLVEDAVQDVGLNSWVRSRFRCSSNVHMNHGGLTLEAFIRWDHNVKYSSTILNFEKL